MRHLYENALLAAAVFVWFVDGSGWLFGLFLALSFIAWCAS